ncbi:MAG: NAD(P)-dependent oxidoreductase, partial [Pseudomonadota bacterium]
MKIAFIGLGVMGGPMAQNIVEAGGHDVRALDIDAAKVAALDTVGATGVSTVADAVKEADLVMTSLPGPAQLEQLAFADDGLFAHIPAGACWIDLSTNNLEIGGRLAAQAIQQGVEMLDAPVSGGDEGARAGSLTVLVGGEAEVFEKYLPVLEIIGSNITHLGPHGAGYSAKISQVILCYFHSLALSEALMLGIKGGVQASQMLSIIQNSTGHSYVADRYG